MTGAASLAPVELLQRLIRFDTTNPPGNEAECMAYLRDLLSHEGFQPLEFARVPERPNLVARLPGRGLAPPLLLYGHVDVVPVAEQAWEHPPFEGRVLDGYVWGRGALDMKSGIAMMLTALLRAKREGVAPAGDVVLALLSDEEAGGDFGARFLVEEHGHLFQGIRYAISEFGGFSFSIGSKKFYPIMVMEKQACWVKATVRGPGGHGAMPVRSGAMSKTGRLLQRLHQKRLPVHVTPSARMTVNGVASALPFPSRLALRLLLVPVLTDAVLELLGKRGEAFDPLLHNTVSATVVSGGQAINVVPEEVRLYLDGRLLPGLGPELFLAELRRLVSDEVDLEVLRYDEGPQHVDMGLFPTLASILREADPSGVPAPLLLAGITDARFFAKLGIQTYGFLPMSLPKELEFTRLVHGANERIPVAAVEFGADVVYRLLQRFGRPASSG